MKKLLILIFATLPLIGCAPAVLVPVALVGATAGGAVIYDKRSLKTLRTDKTAENNASYWLKRDPQLKGRSHISIVVFNRTGLLIGQAQTTAIRDRAYEIATHTKDIKRVYNGVTIAGATSTMQHANDDYLTGKVRAAFLRKSGLKSNDIKVVTEDGVVYLLGDISHQQADLAAAAARHVSGIKKVVKVFEYT